MKRFLCLLLAALFCLSLAACGNNDNGSTPDSASAAQDSSENVKRYASIDDYLNDPEVQKSIDSQKKDSGSAVKMDVIAQGDTLVYQYTYAEHIDDNTVASVKQALEASLEDNAAAFTQVISELQKYVDLANPKVKIVYCNDDGSVITEKVFDTTE